MFFDDIGKTLADLLEPAAVGQTKITTSVPKGKGALEGLEIEVDVNKQAHAIAVDLKHALDMPMDGVRVIARGIIAAESAEIDRERRAFGGIGRGGGKSRARYVERDDRGEVCPRFRRCDRKQRVVRWERHRRERVFARSTTTRLSAPRPP